MADWSKKVVLIVDDNEVDRILLKGLLKKIGFKSIYEAEDGSVANFKLDNITATHGLIDIVFLDVKMPRIDGKKLLVDLKQNSITRNSKIIMVTGVSDKDGVEEIAILGADDYIVKPAAEEILKAKLEKMFKS